jgi:tRNA-dihydrouridine synthase 4
MTKYTLICFGFSHANGVDLNCGCPQRWAIAEGYGCHLINNAELVADMVSQARARLSDPDFTVSVKIRVRDNLAETVELCRRAEHAGVSFISVHGRTRQQRCEPVNLDAIRLAKDCVQVPVYANGDCKSLEDALRIAEYTGVDGETVFVFESCSNCLYIVNILFWIKRNGKVTQ